MISERFFQKITVSVSTRMSNIIRKELRLKWNTGRSLTQIWFCLVRLKILSFWITIVFNWFKSFCINLQYYLFLFGKALSLSNQEWNFTPPPLPKTTKNVENLGFLAVWDFSLVILHILIFLVLFFKFSSKHFKKIIIINRTNQDRYAVCVVYYHYNQCT